MNSNNKVQYKKYKRIIWSSIWYLFRNKKNIAKTLSEQSQSDIGRFKYFRFGTALQDIIAEEDSYVAEFRLYE